MTVEDFYDDMAEYYHLIFVDWAHSMARQGDVIERVLRTAVPGRPNREVRILDVAAGIGTQSLALASKGFAVTARDLSGRSIKRLTREAADRGLRIDAEVSDMRTVADTVQGRFDAVIAFDNAIPHLLDDDEIIVALEGFWGLLSPGGVLAMSVRDYEDVDRAPSSVHPYGVRERDGRTYRFRQEWTWIEGAHYRTTLIGEELREENWTDIVRATAIYYAISVGRLEELIHQAGFVSCVRNAEFYQPMLIARKGDQ